ncbi:ENV1 protein, partial [Eubucco bourcierii]|nr:ENV1 protein [Eubucco bourcierii]
MAKIREGSEKRKRERESTQPWYENLFRRSPWLTTLLPALMGPLIVVLLALSFGPCIINKLISFVSQRIEKVNLMVIQELNPVVESEPFLEAASEAVARIEEQV